MSEPSNKKLDMDGCQVFIDAIRSITGNPTMDRQQCEEWINRIERTITQFPHLLHSLDGYARVINAR